MQCLPPQRRPLRRRSIRWRIIRPTPITAVTWCARSCGERWSREYDPTNRRAPSVRLGRPMSAHGTRGSGMTWVGRAVRRLEDPALVRGQGHFTADTPAAYWVRFVRSPLAAGKLSKISAPAGAMVFTAGDLKGVKKITPMLHKFSYKPIGQPLLAENVVRFAGEPVAAVVAPTAAEAEDISEQIELSIDETTAVSDAREALYNGAPRIHAEVPGNIVFEGQV